ncbi:MAG: methionine synthase [Gemmataceae bacterium]
MTNDFLSLLDQRVLIFDGAMGTNIHRREPTVDDWGGPQMENCTDWMVLTRPDWVRDIHCEFLAVGCDAVETNTFGANAIALGEFDKQDYVLKINRQAAQLAREAVAQFSTPDRPRFVIGSMGPSTKSVTLGHISFDQMAAAYQEQSRGLIEGGVDVLLIETCFDILQAKAAIVGVLDSMKTLGQRLPLMVQVTIEQGLGTMLLGTEIGAALTTLQAYPEVDVIGMNCATGPEEMLEHIRYLSQHCTRRLSCLPNAGLPENIGGKAHFRLDPCTLTRYLQQFVEEFGIHIVGGCCGTTPEHLAEVCRALSGKQPKPRQVVAEPAVSSLFLSVNLEQEPRPLLVGERTNTNGSRKFKQLLEAGDWDGMVEMAREQEREGAHVLDVCTAYVGRDEVQDMREVIRRYNQTVKIPLMIDSTEWPVIEESLKLISGKAIINSINLEEGRSKIDKVVPLAKRYGAALVALTIDEKGQATTADWKFEVAQRIYDICTQEYGIPPSDLLFDPLVFPITTGDESLRRAGIETLDAIRRIKQELPGALTHLGLSNVSFGLTPYTRQVLNSMYLHYALEAGLDSAIVHAAKIMPLSQIDDHGRELCRRLIFDDRGQGDPLQDLMAHYGNEKGKKKEKPSLGATVEERLKQAIIQGRRESLIADLDLAREAYSPLEIINTLLLDGMRVVGDLFGSGQMQLPFVLQSAEVMKAAVAHLQQFMEKIEGTEKGKIVLATVKGDVHDIGKNLVDIILTNNGYKVYNLGIKQPIDNILKAALEHHVDAIGLSGLLVKSTVVMREDLQTLNDRGVTIPVICGGAALTRRYVEDDLRRLYQGPVFYGEDAFTGLRIMDELCLSGKPTDKAQRPVAASGAAPVTPRKKAFVQERPIVTSRRGNTMQPAVSIPEPPFWGARVVQDIPLSEVFAFLNERTLFSTQWQFRKNRVNPKEYERIIQETAIPTLHRLKRWCQEEDILQPAVVYGFFPCASEGDDLLILDANSGTERLRYTFPRQDHGEYLCLSDYFLPLSAGKRDVACFMAVTVGQEVSRRTKELFDTNQYTDYLYLHGLGVEAAEALAEYWHKRIREEWGIATDDAADVVKLFKKHYRGCRYSFGYPACPHLEDQTKLFELLQPERIGLSLTENYQLEPEQSTTALVVHHQQAKYFNVTLGQACDMAS